MPLPPPDVPEHSIFTMSRGATLYWPVRPSSRASSSSTSSSTSTRTHGSSPDFASIQEVIRAAFQSHKITVHQIEQILGCIHQVYLAHLADGSRLVLKCPPSNNVRLLRHEKHLLEAECITLETLREHTQLPVPQVIKYEAHRGTMGSPFLLLSHIPGKRLCDIAPVLTTSQRRTIDRVLGCHLKTLSALSASQFGMTHRVFAKRGCSSWREAFLALLEASLRDAEDMLVTIPYDSIRYYVGESSHYLDDVTEPRFVALNFYDPQNVLIDEDTKQISGLVGFSNGLWGDPLMSGGISDGSEAFFEGLAECPINSGSVKARILMYTIYKEVVRIVGHHYRPQMGADEHEARYNMSSALNDLAAI